MVFNNLGASSPQVRIRENGCGTIEKYAVFSMDLKDDRLFLSELGMTVSSYS